MVRAWYMDESTAEDRNEPNMLNPPKFVDVKYLEKLGILYFQVSHSPRMVLESALSVTLVYKASGLFTTVTPITLLYRSLFKNIFSSFMEVLIKASGVLGKVTSNMYSQGRSGSSVECSTWTRFDKSLF